MRVYRELDPMVEHRMQFAFKDKRQHIVSVNIPNMAYQGQHVDIKISQGSGNRVIVPDTLKIKFNFDITSTDKVRSVVSNVGRALVKKKEFMLGSTCIDVIDNTDIYDTCKDLYLTEKEREEKLLQGIQPANGLKVWFGVTKADGTALTVTAQKTRLKKLLIEGLQYR